MKIANVNRQQALFEDNMQDVITKYSDTFHLPNELMTQHTTIDCVEGEEGYTPYPVLEYSDKNPRDITIVCNVSAYADAWEPVFCSVEKISPESSRKLYIGTALAWVGLVHGALDAKADRENNKRTKNLSSIVRVQKAMQDEKTIMNMIQELETSDQIEVSLYPLVINEEEVQRINRLRFGLGVSYIVNGVFEELSEQFSQQFTEELSNYFKLLGTSLIDFALGFGLDKKVEPQDYKQRGISKAFHSLYFAGIQPMDKFDIMGKK